MVPFKLCPLVGLSSSLVSTFGFSKMACSTSDDFEDFLQDGERDVETDVSSADKEDVSCDEEAGFDFEPVSYTHLTLPTILRV